MKSIKSLKDVKNEALTSLKQILPKLGVTLNPQYLNRLCETVLNSLLQFIDCNAQKEKRYPTMITKEDLKSNLSRIIQENYSDAKLDSYTDALLDSFFDRFCEDYYLDSEQMVYAHEHGINVNE